MVKSEKHKYLFIQNPLTPSTFITHSLKKYYSGERIKHAHASYLNFHFHKNSDQYYSLMTIRSPLYKLVSAYEKMLNNHKNDKS